MLVRTLVAIFNLIGFGIAIALYFLYPSIALPVFYGLLIWYVASFFLYRSAFMSRRIGGPPTSAVGPPASPLPSPLPSAAGPGPAPTPLDFCAFCGTNVKPGTTQCPACGKPIPFL